jgi:hypothetical protein
MTPTSETRRDWGVRSRPRQEGVHRTMFAHMTQQVDPSLLNGWIGLAQDLGTIANDRGLDSFHHFFYTRRSVGGLSY